MRITALSILLLAVFALATTAAARTPSSASAPALHELRVGNRGGRSQATAARSRRSAPTAMAIETVRSFGSGSTVWRSCG